MAIDIDSYYRTYGAMVYRRCKFLLKDEELALDTMQDVFVALIRFQKKLEHRGPSSLLYTIATNLSLNVLRQKKRRNTHADHDLLLQIEGNDRFVDEAHARHFLDALFGEQDQTTRIIAFYHYVDGMTLDETAQQVGMSVSGIRKRLRKLRAEALTRAEV